MKVTGADILEVQTKRLDAYGKGEFLTLKAVQKLLDCSGNHVRALVMRNEFVAPTKKAQWSKVDVAAWLVNHKYDPANGRGSTDHQPNSFAVNGGGKFS